MPTQSLPIPLPKQEIQVWMTTPPNTPSNDYIQSCLAILNDEEINAYHRFIFDHDRFLYLSSHALLRMTLSTYTDVQSAHWIFRKNEYGKPFITNPGFEWLHFNLSHTHGLAACAILHSFELGIDVERIERIDEPSGICERFFTRDECDYILHDKPSEKRTRFIQLWTLKESYIKAVGKGLSIPLDSFSVFIDSHNKASMWIEPEFTLSNFICNFHIHQPTPQHHLAIAYKSNLHENYSVKYNHIQLFS